MRFEEILGAALEWKLGAARRLLGALPPALGRSASRACAALAAATAKAASRAEAAFADEARCGGSRASGEARSIEIE